VFLVAKIGFKLRERWRYSAQAEWPTHTGRPVVENSIMKKVVIFGNQSTAREAFFFLKYYSDYEVVGFTVDKEYLASESLFQLPVSPFDIVETTFPPDQHKMLIAVGYAQNNKIRKERYLRSKELGYALINFVSPKSIIYPETTIGDNCVIGHHTVVSADAKIGNNVIIGHNCTIGHDVVIGDHCFFSCGVSVAGRVNIGSCCYFGTNSTIRNRVSIGNACVIGAGAIILEDTGEKRVYLGEPAALLPISSDELPLG
jgi:sugar O-acyltransferase (sialic acid O-acetyltransferase NeuD family)